MTEREYLVQWKTELKEGFGETIFAETEDEAIGRARSKGAVHGSVRERIKEQNMCSTPGVEVLYSVPRRF